MKFFLGRTLALINCLLLVVNFISAQDIGDSTIEFTANNIPAGHFSNVVGNIRMKNYSDDSALVKLFPGHLYKFKQYDENYTIEVWRCNDCKPVVFDGVWSTEPDTFPIKNNQHPEINGTDTRIIKSLPFKNAKGNDCMLFATNSTSMGEVILVGRFSCAWLGLAVFEHVNDEWVLTAFNPSILCTGAFSWAPQPELLKTADGNAFACKLESANGGAGGAFLGDLYVIGLTQPYMKILLNYGWSSRSNVMYNNWETTVNVGPTIPGQKNPDLTLITVGDYKADALPGDDDSAGIMHFMGPEITQHKNTNFIMKRPYKFSIFSDAIYNAGKEEIELKPVPVQR